MARQMSRVNPAVWAEQALKLRGKRVSFQDHRYQIEPLCIEAPQITIKKATQGGWTQIFLWLAFHLLRFKRAPQGVIYMLPSRGRAYKISQSRVQTIIEENEIAIGRHMKRTNNVLLKRMGHAWLYILWGTLNINIQKLDRESEALSGDPADAVMVDESDLMNQEAIGKAKQRTAHSALKWMRQLANPTVPGFGIDKAYEDSDKRVWMTRCQACNEHTSLDREFPDCLRPDENGIIQRVCIRCGRPVDVNLGEWVPEHPSRSADHVGYWWSQLVSTTVSAKSILDAYRDPSTMAPGMTLSDVYRKILGRAHVAAKDKLTSDQVLACCRDYAVVVASTVPTAIGMDVGKDVLYMVAVHPLEAKALRLIGAWEFRGEHCWDLANAMAKALNAHTQVVDGMAETFAARKYQKKGTGYVFLAQYNDKISGYNYNMGSGVVSAKRTELLDQTHWLATYPGKLSLPYPSQVIKDFALHMSNMTKVPQEDPESGAIHYVYVKMGPDHFRHALGYAVLAANRMSPTVDPDRPTVRQETADSDFDLV